MQAMLRKSRRADSSRLLVAVYADEDRAGVVARRLVDKGFPMDLVSVLGSLRTIGDDPLGIFTLGVGERMNTWGRRGVLWGGLWGAVGGAAGFFVLPGIGPLAAAGNIVESIAAGALLGAGSMAGAAAISLLSIALHRTGIPDEKIRELQEAIVAGKTVLMVRGVTSDVGKWHDVLQSGLPLDLQEFPYPRLIDLARHHPTTTA
jgi:hypothetical protein